MLGAWTAHTQTALTVQQLKDDLYLIEGTSNALPTPQHRRVRDQ